MRLTSLIKSFAVGFVLGILFAPDKGSVTRRRLSGVASDIKDDMAETWDDLTDTVSEKITDIKERITNIAGTAKDEFDNFTISGEERI
ncbi:hypothetical protein BH10BAC2_BH10BAC2_01860 [soil metagenome]